MERTGTFTEHQWQNRSVLCEIDDHRVRRLWRAVLAMAMAVTPWAVYLLQQNERLTVAYEVEALKSEIATLQREERSLNMSRAKLGSLAPIERWASRDHGLIRPDCDCVFVVRDADSEPAELLASAPSGAGKAAR
jgi:cell division protein FtsB